MKIFKLFIFALITITFLNSCSKDEEIIDNPEEAASDYRDGVIVLNEGSQSAGSLSFINQDFNSVENEIFEKVNEGMNLGNYIQSIFFDEENAYIISSGSNLITVVDRYSLEFKDQIDSDLNVPLYGVVMNGKAYVTNVADFSTDEDDYVAIIDLDSFKVENKITAGTRISEIQLYEDMIYIEGAAYGVGNSIEVFDPSAKTFVESIKLFEITPDTPEGLNSFEIYNDELIALSGQNLYKFDIDNPDAIFLIEIPENIGRVSNLEIENNIIYFTSGTSVYSMPGQVFEIPNEPLFTYESSSEYGKMYGFEVKDGYIYTADGGDFASAGSVSIFSVSGELIAGFKTGVAPNGFYFN
ncbi:DUF5074 domain-containing protein [Gramella sp. AN32]|uniref:YncE family protein n=1 Tax=Christiangramia antarctica TaxID=2058158 RepID=A0ABW5X8P1_9FLAO|nr:DUF5074 domain-containing protein [Gramella sp. AN32]MCM4156502.1 quinoprotein amine dehydrogenase [Gramella sp. AN32]